MNSYRLVAALALLAGAGGLTAAFALQDKAPEKVPAKASAEKMSPAMAELMAKWDAFMKPGPEHKVLEPLVGKWTTHVKWWMDPAAPPEESDGTGEVKWIMEGRYLQESHKGTSMGKPFEGMGLVGFDNMKKKYVSTWIDNMGTGITTSQGMYDAAKKTISYTTEGLDPTMTKYVPMRIVDTFVDANTFKMEMYGPDKSGKEFQSMEILYKRVK